MHTWTSSPFASTAGNRAVGECSSIACWKMPSQHSQRDIGLQEPTKQHQNTTCSGYCTKAATPLCTKCEGRLKTQPPFDPISISTKDPNRKVPLAWLLPRPAGCGNSRNPA